MERLLTQMGVALDAGTPGVVALDARRIDWPLAPYELVKTMRASILALGPLLARCGEARVSLPGGCAIGLRPVDQHVKGTRGDGRDHRPGPRLHQRAWAPSRRDHRLRHGDCHGYRKPADGGHARGRDDDSRERRARTGGRRPRALPYRDGRAYIRRGQRPHHGRGRGEPAWSDARGDAGQDRDRHLSCRRRRLPAATWQCAACRPIRSRPVLDKLREAGASIDASGDVMRVRRDGPLTAVNLRTAPHPGFPTDMQAQFMALATRAQGTSVVTETIFENRMMHVQELKRLGRRHRSGRQHGDRQGCCETHGSRRDGHGPARLRLPGDRRPDRGGPTTIDRIYHLDRGYERIEEKLSALGARISRVG
jgi:UDP-N-acetylglucosamine 1-carboxyvinyltransferase